MSWLDELRLLNKQDNDKRKKSGPELDLSVLSTSSVDILKKTGAYSMLKQMQTALLNGQGVINVFENHQEYDRIVALVWQGPISAARRPDPINPEAYHYIAVGVRKGKLYVNDTEVLPTSDDLKAALVQAAKKPRKTRM